LSPRVNYIPGTGPQALFNDANLDVCPESSCKTASIEATITLEANHIGKGKKRLEACACPKTFYIRD
jgi:hypothetical protein